MLSTYFLIRKYEREKIAAAKKTMDAANTIREKSQMIVVLMENVKIGLFMTDSNLTVLEGYSKELVNILELQDEELITQPIHETIFKSMREQQQFYSLYGSAFEDNYLADFYLNQLPTMIKRGDKYLSIHYSPIYDEENNLVKVLFNLADASTLVKNENENQENRRLLSILQNAKNFSLLAEDIKYRLSDNSSLESLSTHAKKMMVHTFKGNLAPVSIG